MGLCCSSAALLAAARQCALIVFCCNDCMYVRLTGMKAETNSSAKALDILFCTLEAATWNVESTSSQRIVDCINGLNALISDAPALRTSKYCRDVIAESFQILYENTAPTEFVTTNE